MKRCRILLGIALAAALLCLLFSASALAAAKPAVSLKAAAKSTTVGQTVLLKGTVTHPRTGVKSVTILELVGTKWRSLATAKLSAKHTFSVRVSLTKAGSWRLRAQYKAGALKVCSKAVVVRVIAWTAVSCGWAHTVALKSDGTLWAWGLNDSGQLGVGGTTDKNAPTRVGSGSTWKAVSAGYDFTLAIKADGTLWAWGHNSHGQLGLGSADDNLHATPTQVDPGSTWKVVAAGYFDAVAIQSDGTLWAWGYNAAGELGLNDTSEVTSPSQVGSLDTWTAASCGYEYSLGIAGAGSLWGSGDNMRGELGLGAVDETETFTQVGSDAWTAVAVSDMDWDTLALKSDGSLWVCGHNDDYQLGLGDTVDKTTLTNLKPGSTWKAVAAGYGFNLAVRSDGSLWTWGSTTSGNLGLGHMSQTSSSPTRVGTASDWAAVACNYDQTMAIKRNGTLWACGDNYYGALGLGTRINEDTLTEVR